MLASVGFEGDALLTAAAVGYAESEGFTDAVGDIDLVSDKWGPSIGWFQIRSLRHPLDYPFPDTLRDASALRDAFVNARTAFEIWKKDGNFLKWSAFKSGAYKEHLGADYELRTGHPRAGEWNV